MKKLTERYFEIAQELKIRYEADQALRRRCQSDPKNEHWDANTDFQNTNRLKKIIEEIGWPSIQKVGEKGAMHAWLLAQHADHDGAFQKYCLSLMKAEPKGNVDTENIAFLEDRVAVSEGIHQLYGTQFFKDSDGEFKPQLIFEPENIEKRRKEMGLDTFEEYQRGMIEKSK